MVGTDGEDEPVAIFGAVEVGDDHADFEDFRVGAADAGGFQVDPQQLVRLAWWCRRVEWDGLAAYGRGLGGVHSWVPFLVSLMSGM